MCMQKGVFIGYWESRSILERWGFELTKAQLTRNVGEAVAFANKIGYPVVMKVESKDIIHKSDAGCVFTNLLNEQDVRFIYEKIMRNARMYNRHARIDGVIVETTAYGVELLLGAKKDELFGNTIVFGIGGVMTELLNDVSIRIAPVTKEEAKEMMSELRFQKLLNGFRGMKCVDRDRLASLISKFSKKICKLDELIELDINPLFADGCRFIVGDARASFSSRWWLE